MEIVFLFLRLGTNLNFPSRIIIRVHRRVVVARRWSDGVPLHCSSREGLYLFIYLHLQTQGRIDRISDTQLLFQLASTVSYELQGSESSG